LLYFQDFTHFARKFGNKTCKRQRVHKTCWVSYLLDRCGERKTITFQKYQSSRERAEVEKCDDQEIPFMSPDPQLRREQHGMLET
jgi:hypothetical protein